MKFDSVARTYETALSATATRETVDLQPFNRYVDAVRSFSREIKKLEDDEYWLPFIRRLRRVMWEVAMTPLPPGEAAFDLESSALFLLPFVDGARTGYHEALVTSADNCVSALDELSGVQENPFGDCVGEVLAMCKPASAVLLLNSRHTDAVVQWLASVAPGVRVVNDRLVHSLIAIDAAVVAGPSYRFASHVLTAPRAEATCFVHYAVIPDREDSHQSFAASTSWPQVKIRTVEGTRPFLAEHFETDLFDTEVDWSALRKASNERPINDSDDPYVRARLFLLADGLSVFLEADDGPTIDTVDLHSADTPRLRSERTRNIGPDDYIVLRTEGGSGDYIPAVADSILGKRGPSLRNEQVRWKAALRQKIRELGLTQVERDLRSRGVRSPNIQYRLARYSMRSQNPDDFRVLMDYIGLGSEASLIWKKMGELAEAHQMAGQEVRKRLKSGIVAADPEQIIQRGRVDVELEEMDAGTLSVLRVEACSPDTDIVSEDIVRTLRPVEDDLWHA